MAYSFEIINLGGGRFFLEELVQFNNGDSAWINDGQCAFVDPDNEDNQMIFDAEQFAAIMRPVELNRFVG